MPQITEEGIQIQSTARRISDGTWLLQVSLNWNPPTNPMRNEARQAEREGLTGRIYEGSEADLDAAFAKAKGRIDSAIADLRSWINNKNAELADES